MQKSIFPQKIQKVCVLQRKHEHKFKFQTQFSQQLQRFRTCGKNKKCSIFHDLSEYIIFHMIVNYWTGPLIVHFIAHTLTKNSRNNCQKILKYSIFMTQNNFRNWNLSIPVPSSENC